MYKVRLNFLLLKQSIPPDFISFGGLKPPLDFISFSGLTPFDFMSFKSAS